MKEYLRERLSEPRVPVKLLPAAVFKIIAYVLLTYPRHPLTPARLVWDANRNFVAVEPVSKQQEIKEEGQNG